MQLTLETAILAAAGLIVWLGARYS